MTKALIDMDALVYRYGLMRRENPEDDPHGWLQNPLAQSKAAILQKIDYIRTDLECTEVVCCMTPRGTPNFRYELHPQYKAHRKPPDPIIGSIKEWLFSKDFPEDRMEIPPRFTGETDDLVGIAHAQSGGATVIVGIDKDFLTVPGWNYNPFTGDLNWISPKSAYLMEFYQCLCGDSADGIPGCRGIGDKKAKGVILGHLGEASEFDPKALWSELIRVYESRGQTHQELWETWLLINVSRPYHEKTKNNWRRP